MNVQCERPLAEANPSDRFDRIFGCMLGTAIGDAVGLKREGLSRERAIWMYGSKPSPDLIFGKGFCSDDTEHTCLVGVALLESGGDIAAFKTAFARLLRKWLLTCPAGIGLGTLRAILKSFFVGPDHCGVSSAGNGPAMRAAIIGVLANNDMHLEQLIDASTRLTHTDPRAEEGALVIARAARFAANDRNAPPSQFIQSLLPMLCGDELRTHFQAMQKALQSKMPPSEFAKSRGWDNGPKGYVNQTVPAAVYCWAYTPNDFKATVTNAVLLGGDTDSVGAIAGAISGSGCGAEHIPAEWTRKLAEWPRGIQWMRDLSKKLSKHRTSNIAPKPQTPSLRWGMTVLRNLLFGTIVVALCLRRFVPIPSIQRLRQNS